MNKMQLIDAVRESLGGSQAAATDAVEAVLDAIVRALVDGDAVRVTGLGTFRPTTLAARKARNPQTGETFQAPAHVKVSFSTGQNLLDLLNGHKELPTGSAIKKAPKYSLTQGKRGA